MDLHRNVTPTGVTHASASAQRAKAMRDFESPAEDAWQGSSHLIRRKVFKMHREGRSLNKAGAWVVLGIAAAFAALLTKPDDARIIASFAAAACLGFAVLQALENARIVTVVYEGFVGLVYRSGKLVDTLPPGKHTVWGLDVHVSTLATRTTLWAVPSQEVLTADSIPVKISLVSTASVSEPKVFALIDDPSALYYSNALCT